MCTGWRYRLAAVLAAVVGEEHERAPLLLDLAQEVTLRREGQQVSPKGGTQNAGGEWRVESGRAKERQGRVEAAVGSMPARLSVWCVYRMGEGGDANVSGAPAIR